MTAAIIDFAEYVERRRNEALQEADAFGSDDAVDACDWCGCTTLVLELRDVAHVFEPLPGGDTMVGDVCALCLQKEHEEREREVGRYDGERMVE